MEESTTEEQILKILEGLGKQSKSIAKHLNKKLIKGKKACGHLCPISTLIKQEINDLIAITVEEEKIYIMKKNRKQSSINIPNKVQIFIKDFDLGKYPELEI